MTTAAKEGRRIEPVAHLRWVPISLMKMPPQAQRELNQSRVEHLAAEFDPEQIGYPTVNKRDGSFYVLDGQHRVAALIQIGWGDQQIQCRQYEGLSEADEAETFLRLNDTLQVNAFAKFRSSVNAGRAVESDIDRIVRASGLRISMDKGDGAIRAVGALRLIYTQSDGPTLRRTLGIVRDAYGDAGLEAPVLKGIGLLCQRYNGQLDTEAAVVKLANAHGGVNGLLNKAETLRRQTGNSQRTCVAAAAVELINAGRGGPKLPSWWRSDTTDKAASA